jgi:hypothetical protein
MAQPIYHVWFMKYTEAWYRLSTEEQNALMAQVQASMKQVGGELIVTCSSVWASEEWLAWGVEKYPSIEAVQQHALNLYGLKWFMYIESKTYLGAEMPQG